MGNRLPHLALQVARLLPLGVVLACACSASAAEMPEYRYSQYERVVSVDDEARAVAHISLSIVLSSDAALQRFGRCWHLNLHSMPSNAYERLGLQGRGPLADFVLGDLNGRTCAPE